MKKLGFLAIIFVVFIFISCGSDNKKKTIPTDDDQHLIDEEIFDDTGDTGDDGNTGNDKDVVDDDQVTDEDETIDEDVLDEDAVDEDILDDDETIDEDVAEDPCHLCDLSNRKCVEQSEGVWICTGCKDDYYENNDSMCTAKGDLGAECDLAEYNNKDCLGGKCVDGVCCDEDCDGLCEGCNVSEFYKGYCSPIPPGTDPDDECDAQDASTCGRNGFCDGAGACQLYGVSAQCQDPYCDGNSSVEAAYCDGAGTCDDGSLESTGCGAYSCDNDTGYCVGGTCTEHDDCAAGYYCDGTTCISKKAVGSLCNEDAECATSACVLDDFGTTGLKYCIPNKTSYCAKDGWYYNDGMTFCDPAGSISYKECDPTSWGTKKSCPNTTQRKCSPKGWGNDCGYLLPDSCSDGSSGHTCEVDTNCKPCEYTYTIKNPISDTPATVKVTSTYIFGGSSCRQTCLAKGFPQDFLCGQQHDIINPGDSHFCYKGELAKTGGDIGVCFEKRKSGEHCEANNWCKSGLCRTSNTCI